MIARLAWHNAMHGKVRAATIVASVGFAILLMFMQLGFYSGAAESAGLLLNQLDFDVVLVSPEYVCLAQSGSFAITRTVVSSASRCLRRVCEPWISRPKGSKPTDVLRSTAPTRQRL